MEVADDQEDQLPEVNFVPCVKFIGRGIASAKSIADGIKPNQDAATFQEMFGTTTQQDDDEDDDSEDENQDIEPIITSNNQNPTESVAVQDEFNFENYDNENTQPALKISDVVEVTEDDQIADSENDSEAEDDVIKPEDNLILVARVEMDCASLEVFLYNEEENSLYVHHDFILPFAPLCVEWFSYDPGSQNQAPGNLCAIGGMEPIIHIYDLDIHQPLEPVLELGRKGSKKKNIKRLGHRDAVLDLSWNKNYEHIIASGSVDKTVILWDIEKAKPELRLKDFADKVQSICFNPVEAEYLLTGCGDKTVKLFDCRQSDNEGAQYKKWDLDGEVEKVKWNISDKHYFFTGTNNGKIAYFDSRGSNDPLWIIDAHEKEVTDFGLNSKAPNMLTSTSVDGLVKIWKFDNSNCNLIQSHHYKLGRIHCLDECPENPFIFVIGGDKRKKNLTVVNSLDFDNVKKEFTDLAVGDSNPREAGNMETEEMDEDDD